MTRLVVLNTDIWSECVQWHNYIPQICWFYWTWHTVLTFGKDNWLFNISCQAMIDCTGSQARCVVCSFNLLQLLLAVLLFGGNLVYLKTALVWEGVSLLNAVSVVSIAVMCCMLAFNTHQCKLQFHFNVMISNCVYVDVLYNWMNWLSPIYKCNQISI